MSAPQFQRFDGPSRNVYITGQEGENLTTQLGDSPSVDAFGRLRVSNPSTIFDSQLQYDKQPFLWLEKVSGSATATHRPNESAVDMTVTTADGDSIIRQTRDYFRYQPGKSQFIKMTGTMGAAQSGTTKLIGYGDADNGLFFGVDGGGVFVMLRSKVTGSVVDTKVYQADWNKDKLDGTGKSGITLDITKGNIFLIDLEWLGVGRVRMCFNIDGTIQEAHAFNNANNNPSTYMTTANLPVRYEITNTAAVTAPATLKQICTEVESEGSQELTLAYPFSTELQNAPIPNGIGNIVIIFATRHAATFNGITNRGFFRPDSYEVLPAGGTVFTRVLYNPTLTGGTWAAVDSNSFMEGNSTVTSFTGGLNTGSSVVGAGNKSSPTPIFGKTLVGRLPFGLDIDGANPVTLALAAWADTNNVTANFTFQWEEYR